MRLTYIILAIIAFGCSDSEQSSSVSTPIEETKPVSTINVDTSSEAAPAVDRALISAAIQRSVDSVIKLEDRKFKTKYTTLAQVMRKVFSEYSTKEEVYNVQGAPKMKQSLEGPNLIEVWVYGNCEVHFEGNLVKDVYPEGCKKFKYKSIGELLMSDDYLEKEFGNSLMSRKARSMY
ncbi:hypothetical protein [Flaviaesturariibacter amylovorans]|uniref:Uncharacterized protein n=1 Tax=Flaviaesturariibacter amylovorans TaxID=1084520 RepID=A0ABP8G3P2_9BACT